MQFTSLFENNKTSVVLLKDMNPDNKWQERKISLKIGLIGDVWTSDPVLVSITSNHIYITSLHHWFVLVYITFYTSLISFTTARCFLRASDWSDTLALTNKRHHAFIQPTTILLFFCLFLSSLLLLHYSSLQWNILQKVYHSIIKNEYNIKNCYYFS